MNNQKNVGTLSHAIKDLSPAINKCPDKNKLQATELGKALRKNYEKIQTR